MRKWTVLAVLLCVAVSFGSDIKRVSIEHFAYGLYTASPSQRIPLGAATQAHNLDLTTNFDVITKREGYSSVVVFRHHDSILWNGLKDYTQRNGDMRLLAILDSTGAGYANIFASEMNSPLFGILDSVMIVPDPPAGAFDMVVYVPVDCLAETWGYFFMSFDAGATKALVVDSLYYHMTNRANWKDQVTVADLVDSIRLAPNSDTCPIIYAGVSPPTVGTARFFGGASSSQIYTRFPATHAPKYAQLLDWLYITNGVAKTIAYNGHHITTFPKAAPGEIDAIPLSGSGNLRGEYHYALRVKGVSDTTSDTITWTKVGHVGTKVVAENQNVLLYDPPYMAYDVQRVDYADPDTVTYEIWRTTGDVGVFDKLDTLWNTGYTIHCDGNYETVTLTDTIGDSLLRQLSSAPTPTHKMLLEDTLYHTWLDGTNYGGELNYFQIFQVPGAPGLLSADSVKDSTGHGIWNYPQINDTGSARWDQVSGFVWIFVALDTLMNAPSDSGWSFVLNQPAEAHSLYVPVYDWDKNIITGPDTSSVGFSRLYTEQVTFCLPQSTDDDLQYLVYRGPVIPVKYDTLAEKSRECIGEWELCIDPTGEFWEWCCTEWAPLSGGLVGKEFDLYGLYFLGSYAPGDTIIDSLPYDSLLLRDPYIRNAIPNALSDIIAYDNRLVATDGDFVYLGDVYDDELRFDLFHKLSFNPSDGQSINALWAEREVIKVAKTTKMYNLYKINDTLWKPTELSAHYGAVNSLTHAVAPEGNYFLSHDQVRRESEGAYKSRSFVAEVVSSQIASFRDMPLATKTNSYGFYHDDKYIVSVPSYDTAFVLNKNYGPDGREVYGWTTWGVTPVATAKFASVEDVDLAVGDTLYFALPGDSILYLFGGTGTDNYSEINWSWKSGVLNEFDGHYYSPLNVGVMVEAPEDTVEYIVIQWEDDRDSTNTAQTDTIQRADSARIHFFDLAPPDPGWTWKIEMSYGGADRLDEVPTTQQYIDGIIMEFVRHGRIKSQ